MRASTSSFQAVLTISNEIDRLFLGPSFPEGSVTVPVDVSGSGPCRIRLELSVSQVTAIIVKEQTLAPR